MKSSNALNWAANSNALQRGYAVFALRIHKIGCIALIVFIFSPMAQAEDITTLQTAVSFALAEMEKATAEHDANVQAITQQQQLIERQKKQLADDIQQLDKAQKEAAASQKRHFEARKKFENLRSRLDKAWRKK